MFHFSGEVRPLSKGREWQVAQPSQGPERPASQELEEGPAC